MDLGQMTGPKIREDTPHRHYKAGRSWEPIGVAKHVFSHVQWDMVGYRVKIAWENKKNTEELLETFHA